MSSIAPVSSSDSFPTFDLSLCGLDRTGVCHWNTRTTQLVEMALARGEGMMARNGALAVTRPAEGWPHLRPMVVNTPAAVDEVNFNLDNIPLEARLFTILYGRLLAFLQGRELFIQDRELGVHDSRKIRIRVISTTARHALLSHQILRPFRDRVDPFFPDFTIFIVPEFAVSPVIDQIPGPAASVIDLTRRLGLILGTGDTAEFSRMIFRLLSFDLPSQGKTPLLGTVIQARFSDEAALILGSDASDRLQLALATCESVFDSGDEALEVSFDGPITLREGGMDILAQGATSPIGDVETSLLYPFGTLVESTGLTPDTRTLLHPESALITWPAICLPQCSVRQVTQSPRRLIIGIRDDSGALPPIAKISPEFAAELFELGPSIQGISLHPSEAGESVLTFDPCFAHNCLLRPARTFADGLLRRLTKSAAKCWLINLGGTLREDGSLAEVSQTTLCRFVQSTISGVLDRALFRRDALLGCSIPTSCPGFGARELDPIGFLRESALDVRESAARSLVEALRARGAQHIGGLPAPASTPAPANEKSAEDAHDAQKPEESPASESL